jgi:YHS domain-containing protein
MKKLATISAVVILICMAISSCSIFKSSTPEYAIDPVCGMKVDKAEAYTSKYNGQKYYFDNYNCRESFKMNPESILAKKKCDVK